MPWLAAPSRDVFADVGVELDDFGFGELGGGVEEFVEVGNGDGAAADAEFCFLLCHAEM